MSSRQIPFIAYRNVRRFERIALHQQKLIPDFTPLQDKNTQRLLLLLWGEYFWGQGEIWILVWASIPSHLNPGFSRLLSLLSSTLVSCSFTKMFSYFT
jgi:hypothetical protein